MNENNLEIKNQNPIPLEQVEVIDNFLRFCKHRHMKDICRHMQHKPNPHIYNVVGIMEIQRPGGNKVIKKRTGLVENAKLLEDVDQVADIPLVVKIPK